MSTKIALDQVNIDAVSLDDFTTVQAAVDSGASVLLASAGTYNLSEVTGTRVHIKGAGKGLTKFVLSTTGTETMFDVAHLTLEDCTLDDNGRSGIDKTSGSTVAVFLCETNEQFIAKNVEFITDRSVVFNNGTLSSDQLVIVQDCSLTRKTAPITSEVDTMNLFTLSSTRRIFIKRLEVEDVLARSVVNASYTQATSHSHEPAIAIVEGCSFEYVRQLNIANECKVLFFQGYATKIDTNVFTDCFGRNIDVLSNYVSADPLGNLYRSHIVNNTISFTTARQAVTGALNDEPGCIYCRYGDVVIENNHLDFSQSLLSSNIYGAINVRHGYKSAVIASNTIISPIANGILADISDAIVTDEISVRIKDNTILNASNSSRVPIKVANNDNTLGKIFDYTAITGNLVEYASSEFIEIEQQPAVAEEFGFKTMVIKDNFNKTFGTWDDVDFKNFPEYLEAPKANVTIQVDTGGTNTGGIITDAVKAMDAMSKYNCKSLTVQIEPSVLTDITISGPEAYTPMSQTTIIDGSNGTARFKFVAAETDQTNISFTLDNNILVLDDIRCESANAAGTTTALVRLSGTGDCAIIDGEYQYAEILVDTRGPNVSLLGCAVNDIDKGGTGAVAFVFNTSRITPKVTFENLTGSNVTELYNCASPAFIAYENLTGVPTTGTKTFTVVV
jgi:hypothetical protein